MGAWDCLQTMTCNYARTAGSFGILLRISASVDDVPLSTYFIKDKHTQILLVSPPRFIIRF